jgi:hypothetical protein
LAVIAAGVVVRGRGGTGTSPTLPSSPDALAAGPVPQTDDQSCSAALLVVEGVANTLWSGGALFDGGGGKEGPAEARVVEGLLATRMPLGIGGVANRGGASSGRMLVHESGVIALLDAALESGGGGEDLPADVVAGVVDDEPPKPLMLCSCWPKSLPAF